MQCAAMTPYLVHRDGEFVPNPVAHGGWGPTLGGQVVGGLLARTIEEHAGDDADLHPARLTVEILRRVAGEPVRVTASVVRAGARMRAIDAVLTQGGELVARASALYLRRGPQPDGEFFSTAVTLPPPPPEPAQFDDTQPMFIAPYGKDPGDGVGFPWQTAGPRYAWVREVRDLVAGEALTPLVRAALAVDVTSSLTNFSTAGLAFINADYTLSLSRLPVGPHIGLAALTHYSDSGVATGSAGLFDTRGPIGTGTSTAIANPGFDAARTHARPA